MILKNITFTGADDNTDPKDLYKISSEYPDMGIEWGILWYPKKMGTHRYPTKEWIKKFLTNKPNDVNTSLHVCGDDAWRFMYELHTISELEYIRDCVNRIQLNLPISRMTTDNVLDFLDIHGDFDFRFNVNKFCVSKKERSVIIQSNKGNKILNTCLEYHIGIDFLFDESRGGGKSIINYPEPYPNNYSGYAGGINPINILDVIHSIEKIVPKNEEIWIDMETGVRSKNEFDLDKVRDVIESIIVC